MKNNIVKIVLQSIINNDKRVYNEIIAILHYCKLVSNCLLKESQDIYQDIDACVKPYYKPRLKLFKNLIGNTVADALLYMPISTVEKFKINELSKEYINKQVIVNVTIDNIEIPKYSSNRPIVILGHVYNKSIELLFFNYKPTYLKGTFDIGNTVQLTGQLTLANMCNYQIINPKKTNFKTVAGIYNIYPLRNGVTQDCIYSITEKALDILNNCNINEWLPEYIINKYNFYSFYKSLKEIHKPNTNSINLIDNIYRRRICFDEVLAEQITIQINKAQNNKCEGINGSMEILEEFINTLPFKLTISQEKAINEIINDMKKNIPMKRLIQGDVGSGKTIVAILAMLYVIQNGYQCALLVPTEMLARQHYNNIKQYLTASSERQNDSDTDYLNQTLARQHFNNIKQYLTALSERQNDNDTDCLNQTLARQHYNNIKQYLTTLSERQNDSDTDYLNQTLARQHYNNIKQYLTTLSERQNDNSMDSLNQTNDNDTNTLNDSNANMKHTNINNSLNTTKENPKYNLNNIRVEILTANEKGKIRKSILAGVKDNTVKIIVGTHALFNNKLEFNNLGLVIVDEQHRFGVNQRLSLINKGNNPHILSMTATPIPRTIIMSMHGDIDVSSIEDKPMGRKEIITKSLTMDKINELISAIRRVLNKGEKVYWICPLIEDSEKLDYTCVIDRYNFLKQYFDGNIEMLHGKMSANEKQQVFDKFNTEEVNILVSTTVIEVGIDVHNATVIIIENAERFGLAQLHQLRGRVGRSNLQSYCILLYDKHCSQIARQRIKMMCSTNNGFKISEYDLKLRGGGEINGIKQSGMKKYKTFDYNNTEDQEIINEYILEANTLAKNIVKMNSVALYKDCLRIFKPNFSLNVNKSF